MRLSTYFQHRHEMFMRPEDVFFGLSRTMRMAIAVLSWNETGPFLNRGHNPSSVTTYPPDFISQLSLLFDQAQYGYIIEHGYINTTWEDADIDFSDVRQRRTLKNACANSREWLRQFDAFIRDNWAALLPRLKYYSALVRAVELFFSRPWWASSNRRAT